MPTDGTGAGLIRAPVWDLAIRLFHWSLAACVAGAWSTAEAEDWDTHLLFGYGVLGLILFRLIWGFIGSETARFRSFLKGPRAVAVYAADLLNPEPPPTKPGHNPLGGWAVMGLLGLLTVQVGTGLFLSGGDILVTEAPLSRFIPSALEDTLAEVHETAFDILAILITLHITAIAMYALVRGQDLIIPMLTGRASVLNGTAPRMRPWWAGLALATLVALGVWAFVTLV